ncbi:iron complex transport system substrate-binding protein [Halanaerobium saccharolyticum]|uniref:Iron complex transport system substrate-binding protein n=1 Tax=Halanaerobium saccharolyticum TaxID=43595 RepID=A0A4V3G5T8_9FIRM|nr:ABC transporter substrate-binding protein [Halanaerobium saccharolyticum]RAK10588.1 iron complex transport system substrate-binding protein [Halanaerobium saccharolyticum]TDW06655.1 iron complex transport system substrate-binding protein [Halanaerobium saccharolyticum]TDX62290.1 iron complex transport system substrate-binding protein [Halanaerobium saccharolyticum]
MKKKIITILFCFIILVSLLGAYALAKDHYPVTVKNYNTAGDEYKITFEKKPERVITTNQPPTELLLRLGLEDFMVGTAWLDNPISAELKEKYEKIPVLSDRYPAKEVVIAKEADLIMGWNSVFSPKNLGTVESWNSRGVKTFIQRNSGVIKNRGIDNIYKDISDIGKIFNIEARAAELINSMKDRIEIIQKKTEAKKTVKVLILEGAGNNKYRSYGRDSLVNEMVEKAGGINLAKKSGTFSPENIIAKNPDIIILIYYLEQDNANKTAESLKNNSALQNVKAIKNNRIVYTPLAETYAGGVRTINGIERFAEAFYPELFR